MPHKIKPHRRGNRYYFSPEHRPESFLRESLPSFFASLFTKRSVQDARAHQERWHEPAPHKHLPAALEKPRITWIGHATFLIQLGSCTIITDPIFGNATWLFQRILPPGVSLTQLPTIDAVLLSHNHPDHLDFHSVSFLKKQNPHLRVLVPDGDGQWFKKHQFPHIIEHDWWQTTTLSPIGKSESPMPIACMFVPAAHWSRRGLFDTNRSLWGGWVISWNNSTFYFAGDTAYAHHFQSIAKEFPRISAALLPIGPCEPREWMKRSHMSAHEAGQAFLDLNAHAFIPMHWGTFSFGTDHFDAPIHSLRQWWQEQEASVANKSLHIMKAGSHFELSGS